MRNIYIGIGLYALSFLLFATGHLGSALLCIVVATGLVVMAHESKREARRRLYTPKRVIYTPEQVEEAKGWQEILSAVTTHEMMTGCRVTKADFVNREGLCPYGGTYDEHN